jgi:hypothetical protein
MAYHYEKYRELKKQFHRLALKKLGCYTTDVRPNKLNTFFYILNIFLIFEKKIDIDPLRSANQYTSDTESQEYKL